MMSKLLLILVLFSQVTFADKPELFLLKTYDDSRDVVGWVMSEKLDGIRGFWNGRELLTRSGKKINAPAWFTQNYPPFSIDGELWTKRGDFENISSIVRTKNSGDRWKKITHQIFEVPNQQGGLLERLSVLKAYLNTDPIVHLQILKQTSIDSKQQLKQFLAQVTDQKGEGVVVRNPNTLYKTGRLPSALKVKKYFDTECTVLKILPGKGKYKAVMGSVLCQTSTGKELRIGSGFKDKDRESPPAIGSEITFKYYGFTKKGKFKYPVYLREKLTN
ncbi:MAG: DNA ligase [Candidatus Thioglobus sp.]|nr:DNA ligase [Candidatus Thioglobus sp.]MBT3432220.1 DNA ligase [Candidatus Thioglobus sp.]MBT4315775.1 DNA ligase [Candidatus Thioglobus sp.]MBT4553447.1 DNA ligase [Candidatus Thioglobus sp.]MBT4923774.1 DNA ligase [Candidatus Thioglobus sp.]